LADFISLLHHPIADVRDAVVRSAEFFHSSCYEEVARELKKPESAEKRAKKKKAEIVLDPIYEGHALQILSIFFSKLTPQQFLHEESLRLWAEELINCWVFGAVVATSSTLICVNSGPKKQ
jgi:hypothetical protein